jgi:diguanylate cyclase (GGDEF)-like protein/PAS domain S-box-containing protein
LGFNGPVGVSIAMVHESAESGGGPVTGVGREAGFERAVLRAMTDVIAIVDGDGRLGYVSSGARALLGYPDGELVGTDAFDLVHPDDQASALEGFDSTLGFVDSRPTPLLLRLRRADGSWAECEVIATNHLADGDLLGLLLSIRDVSESMRTEQALRDSEERYRLIVELAREGIWVIDSNAVTTYANRAMAEMLETTVAALVGQSVFDFMDDNGRRETVAYLERRADGIAEEHDSRLVTARGRALWTRMNTSPIVHRDGTYQGAIALVTDVTRRRARLERQNALAELGRYVLTETSLEVVVKAATDLINRLMPDAECRIVSSFADPADAPSSSSAGGAGDVSARPGLRVPVGDPHDPFAYVEVFGAAEPLADDTELVEGVAGILVSAIVRTRALDEIRHQATHDPLTGLPNRTLFNDRLEHALRRRTRVGGYVAVMVIDLDGFKNVNDSLGHLTGDALLIAVADRFDAHLRDFDTIARLGGDEFAILVDDLDAPNQAGLVAQRVLDALSAPLRLRDRSVAIGASIGIALVDRHDIKADRLLSHADAAMYQAKREGKGCYRVFEAAMHTAAVDRMNLEQALRAALTTNALAVHYQPVVDTRTGRVTTFEALARWPHPAGAFIPPDTFIPLAEDSGLIIELGRAVLLQACEQARQWSTASLEHRPSISVNASRLQLTHPNFVEHVTEALARADLHPSQLILEVTESVLAGEPGRIIHALDELRGTGIRVAIDDFGTGYSSFAALAELPIDILKIDKRFIDNLTRNEEGRGIVIAILQLAQTLKLETIAEGVEHADQTEALTELGCTHIQGYLYSRPMPGDQTHAYLARGNESCRSAGAEL